MEDPSSTLISDAILRRTNGDIQERDSGHDGSVLLYQRRAERAENGSRMSVLHNAEGPLCVLENARSPEMLRTFTSRSAFLCDTPTNTSNARNEGYLTACLWCAEQAFTSTHTRENALFRVTVQTLISSISIRGNRQEKKQHVFCLHSALHAARAEVNSVENGRAQRQFVILIPVSLSVLYRLRITATS